MIKLDHFHAKEEISFQNLSKIRNICISQYLFYLTIGAYVLINNRHELTNHP